MAIARKPTYSIPSLRWWIAGILFASTVINYIDRQTLSLLAPYLKLQYQWTNSDYANIVIGFRIAYTIGQTVLGRLMDRLGHKAGIDPHGRLVFDRIRFHRFGSGALQLCRISLLARSGRIRELAGRYQSGFRVVSKTRTGAGDRNF